jgi:hypothetical protein
MLVNRFAEFSESGDMEDLRSEQILMVELARLLEVSMRDNIR